MESGTAMTRCRDRIIERSKGLSSVALMSAAGAAVFGVAGADGRGGSHWAVAHATPAHARVVHATSGFSSSVISTAWRPSAASPTTSRSGSLSSKKRRPLRTTP